MSPIRLHNPAPLFVPDDTTPEAARVQWNVWRRTTPIERLRVGYELSNSVRRRLEQGVRMRHPDYDQETVNKAVLLLMHGPQLFSQVFPGSTVQP